MSLPVGPRNSSERLLVAAFLVFCGVGVLAALASLGSAVVTVWQRSGAIVGGLLAAALFVGAAIPAPLALLRVARLLGGTILGASGALLTLMLGVAVEHPRTTDPILGGVMLTTFIAFAVTLATDLRMQVLDARATRRAEQVTLARHEALLDAPAKARPQHPSTAGPSAAVLGGALATGFAAGWFALRRRRRM